MSHLTLIIPCFNEAKNLPHLLQHLLRLLSSPEIEVILVDNGSTDTTPTLLQSLPHSRLRSIRVEKNQGYGYGILCGLRAATTPFLGWMHADLQTDPLDLLPALELIRKASDPSKIFVKGKRYGRKMGDLFFTIGMAAFESCLLKTLLWDINAQPNVFHRSFFETWKTPPHDFALDLYAYHKAKQEGLDIQRLPVYFGPRLHDLSRWNTSYKAKLRFILRTVKYSLELSKKRCY